MSSGETPTTPTDLDDEQPETPTELLNAMHEYGDRLLDALDDDDPDLDLIVVHAENLTDTLDRYRAAQPIILTPAEYAALAGMARRGIEDAHHYAQNYADTAEAEQLTEAAGAVSAILDRIDQ